MNAYRSAHVNEVCGGYSKTHTSTVITGTSEVNSHTHNKQIFNNMKNTEIKLSSLNLSTSANLKL